jgi:SAM-dependent methyltransferase
MDPRSAALRASYDRVADEYAARFFDELVHKPLDRALLDCFAELARGRGQVADVGCGPGQIARALHERGLPALGVDLSPAMVALARRLTPEVAFHEGSLLALPAPAGAWGGLTAFYAFIHLRPEELPAGMAEFARVLRPGAPVLLAFHIGRETVHRDELWGQPVDLDFQFYETATVVDALESAGFAVEARVERAPYTVVEYPSQRGYILARKPDAAPA